jgi:hypothetical protein
MLRILAAPIVGIVSLCLVAAGLYLFLGSQASLGMQVFGLTLVICGAVATSTAAMMTLVFVLPQANQLDRSIPSLSYPQPFRDHAWMGIPVVLLIAGAVQFAIERPARLRLVGLSLAIVALIGFLMFSPRRTASFEILGLRVTGAAVPALVWVLTLGMLLLAS